MLVDPYFFPLFINVNLEKMPINKGVKNIIAQINLIYVVNSCFYIYIYIYIYWKFKLIGSLRKWNQLWVAICKCQLYIYEYL